MKEARSSRVGRLLTIGLMAPVIGAFLRKLVPGQPITVEVGISMLGLGSLLFFGLRQRGRFYLPVALGVWILFNLGYLLPGLAVDYRIPGLAMFTRILPLLLATAAALSIRRAEDFRLLCRCYIILAVIHLPIGIWVLFFGNSGLPVFFQPLLEYQYLGKGMRAGFAECVGVFGTPSILANTMLIATFLALAGLQYERGRWKAIYAIAILASLLLLYMSTRRGALFMAAGGLGIWFIFVAKNRLIGALAIALAVGAFVAVDSLTRTAESNDHESRLGHFGTGLWAIGERFDHYFLQLVYYWFEEAPLGTYLGSVGREARAFGVLDENSAMVESGGPQTIAETGLVGFVLFPFVVMMLALGALRGARSERVRRATLLLVSFHLLYFMMFYFKEMLCLNNLSAPHLFFWAVPGICRALVMLDLAEARVPELQPQRAGISFGRRPV